MPIHVSIHDVSPAWKSEVELALSMCHEARVRPALLVVPNFHGQWPLADAPSYGSYLRALQHDGHEIYLHGFFHRSRSTAPSTVRARARWLFAQKVASGGEAEFSDVSKEEAIERLANGERILHAAGLTIDGFIPPAWSMPNWLLPLLAERGYTFCEDHMAIYNPARNVRRASVVLNYASRSPLRLASTVAYCRVAKYARALVPTRIAIHPADMRVALLRAEVRSLLQWASGDVVGRAAGLFS